MPSISPGQTSSHACVQFLNSVLSRPNALPYEEEVKWSIRQHLVNVIQHFPGLQARTAGFTHNDGRQANLLQADGTIPMYYQDVKYNIPVTIWLTEPYPRKPPLVYVSPTRDMIIKPRHRLVDASGMVSVPYLQQWVFPRSNLVELVQNLSLHFGHDPPLYSRPSTPVPSPQQQQQQQLQQQTQPQQQPQQPFHGMNPIYSSNSPPPTSAAPIPYPPPYYQQQQQQQQPSTRTEDPASVFKRNAVNTLVARVQQDVVSLRSSFEVEMDELFSVQASLNKRAEQLGKHLQELQHEKEGLEQQLQLLLTNTDVLETWLQSNDGPNASGDMNIDEAFEPCDVLSRQMLEASAEDLAIEDVLYSLDKAVQEGVITAEVYLRHVRMLARDQFFYRATSAKVRTAQMQAQVAGMAARAAPPPYVSS
ncbi:protein ELC [Selaginella moellendorffii]|uniref:protein ELC n=1 Tax=Selaginella moellendorffii TaxID=88036 RepID=UPI000D1C82B9|nr:protein ELC [Selaginella moellendorffii]|eukprot:XP_024518557.1 protein ELC [Selaginella moellendorffii]